jgi:nucleoside-diphosphate-sugar epimerase
MQHPNATNEDFNLSTAESTTVLDLAKLIWTKINGNEPFKATFDNPYEHDVQKRIPSVLKAKQVLGFEATTSLDAMLDEVIPWISDAIKQDFI